MPTSDLPDAVARLYGGWCGNCGPDDLACSECAYVASDEVHGVLDAIAAYMTANGANVLRLVDGELRLRSDDADE